MFHSLLLFSEMERQGEGVLEERMLTNLSKQVGLLGLCEQTATIAMLDLPGLAGSASEAISEYTEVPIKT